MVSTYIRFWEQDFKSWNRCPNSWIATLAVTLKSHKLNYRINKYLATFEKPNASFNNTCCSESVSRHSSTVIIIIIITIKHFFNIFRSCYSYFFAFIHYLDCQFIIMIIEKSWFKLHKYVFIYLFIVWVWSNFLYRSNHVPLNEPSRFSKFEQYLFFRGLVSVMWRQNMSHKLGLSLFWIFVNLFLCQIFTKL